jgi:PKD repeat protein
MKNNTRFLTLFLIGLTSVANGFGQSNAVIPSRFLPGDKAIRPAFGDQIAPEIASGSNVSLAVWQDKRAFAVDLPFVQSEWETSSDIYAVRIDASGQILDRVPLVVTQEAASQSNPQVVWNGTNWLVLFQSIDINGTGFFYEDSLEAVRVSPAGVVLDPQPIKIRNVAPAGNSSWAAASDGVDWVVAFQESDSNSALALLKITAAGAVLQGPKVVVPSTYFLRSNLRLAFTSGVYLFTWAEFSDTQALRFDSNLNVLSPAFRLVTGHIVTDLTSSDSQFYGVWFSPVQFVDQVFGSRISTTGTVLDGGGNGVQISNNSSTPDGFIAAFDTWDGSNFRVNWASNSKLFTARVSPTGSVLDPGGVLIPRAGSGPSSSPGNGALQVVWSALQQNVEYDTSTVNISATNVPGPVRSVSVGAPSQTRSDSAAGSGGFMIVFRSDISRQTRIMAQPLDLNGNPLANNPTLLTTGSPSNGPGAPAVAWNGSLYLATWSTATGIVAQRINQDGTLIDAVPFAVMPGFGPTEVSALGETFLVIARQFVNNNPEVIVPVVSRINGTTGTVLDPNGIAVGPSFCVSVSVATFGDRWLTVFRSNVNHDETLGTTYGAFVHTDGTKENSFAIYGPSNPAGNGIVDVSVASNGTNALALQSAPLTSTSETDLVGVIVNSNGSHGSGINLTPWKGNQYSPDAAWNGTHYVIVFNDQVNRFAPFTLDQFDVRSDLIGMRVAADGTKIDPMGFVFSAIPAAESWPSVTAGNGLTLISGSIMRNEQLDAYRIGYQLYGQAGNQWPIAVATANTSSGDIPLTVTFDSTGTTDLDGTIVSYFWDFGDGTTSTSQNPQHTYTVPGKYVATLTVTDNLGVKSTDTASVEATAPNMAPVAKFIVTPPGGRAPLNVVLTSDESYDPDGAIGNRHWTFSDGGDYWGETAFHTFSRPGTFRVTLTVFDNDNATGESSQTVVVTQ